MCVYDSGEENARSQWQVCLVWKRSDYFKAVDRIFNEFFNWMLHETMCIQQHSVVTNKTSPNIPNKFNLICS